MTLDTRDIGVEVGYMKDFFLKAAITNGARAPRVRPTLLPTFDRNLGFVVNGGYQGVALAVPFLLGASYLYERRVPPGAVVKGVPPAPVATGRQPTWLVNLYGQFNVGDFSMLGEFAYGRHTPFVDDNSFGFYIRSAYNILDHWSISGRVGLFARDRNFLSDNLTRYVISSEYHFSKYASIEPMIRLNREQGPERLRRNLQIRNFFVTRVLVLPGVVRGNPTHEVESVLNGSGAVAEFVEVLPVRIDDNRYVHFPFLRFTRFTS
ncbi:MAG: hypothetical protein IIB38_16315 [Candidatus Hydrogenedentes bacterium]|nr:hypothetical protein [Candidatus Hydrogenedentota bacterium]